MDAAQREQAMRGIVRVGEGSGFLVQGRCTGFIVTAAHCLPRLPDPLMAGDDEVYVKVKSRVNDAADWVLTTDVFIDPCSDVAVLSEVDNQRPDLGAEWEKYCDLVEQAKPLPISLDIPDHGYECRAYLPQVDGTWSTGTAYFAGLEYRQVAITLDGDSARIQGGTSGSPLLNANGEVIGVVKIGSTTHPDGQASCPAEALPGWILRLCRT